ncbi:MAG: HDOD domain-containing protein, partial [Flavobacteriales bacterium]|nr:HDOD domain-containing protein [Flavobacteriales bacterium]
LMKHWHFPRSIIAPCRYHHHPDKAPQEFRRPSLILNFADYITQKIGIGHSGNPVQTKIQNPPEEIGIDQSYLKNIIDLLRNKEEGIKEFYNIIDPH